MPKSVSSTSSGGRFDSGFSNRFGASLPSHHSLRRSPSPTEFYRERFAFNDRLEDRLFELNKFIHHAVDRFLDKQTVLDLIKSYDNDEDLFASDDDDDGDWDNDFLRTGSDNRSIVHKLSDNLKIFQPVGKGDPATQSKTKQNDFFTSLDDQQDNSKFSKRFGRRFNNFPGFIGIILAKLFHIRKNANRRRGFGED